MSAIFILYIILFMASQALMIEILSFLNIKPKESKSKLYLTFVWWSSVALGFVYISKLYIVLFVLGVIHSGTDDEEFENSKWYKYLDYTICCAGFLYQILTVCEVLSK